MTSALTPRGSNVALAQCDPPGHPRPRQRHVLDLRGCRRRLGGPSGTAGGGWYRRPGQSACRAHGVQRETWQGIHPDGDSIEGVVTDQPSLFDVGGAGGTAPICHLCGSPCSWMPRAQRWGNYCGGVRCISVTRICKQCGRQYERDGGGLRYCSRECRELWHYGRVKYAGGRSTPKGPCSYCSADRLGTNTWDLCGECYERVQPVAAQLRMHHVPLTMVHRLLEDETCFNPQCDRNILERIRSPRSGQYRLSIAVDHDHSHCPGAASCGICVRGLLCGKCNTAAGMLDDDAKRASGLAEYLMAWAIFSDGEDEKQSNT